MMKNDDVLELLTILDKHTKKEPFTFENPNGWTHGGAQQEERIMHVADWCTSAWPGDLVQITCQIGGVTRALAAVARKHGRRVIALMLWGKGASNWNCPDATHPQDMKLIKPFWDIVDVVPGRPRFEQLPTCFAFVDSPKDYRAYKNDIGLVSHCGGIIAVNNTLWHVHVGMAFLAKAHDLRRGAIQHPLCREGYLLPCG